MAEYEGYDLNDLLSEKQAAAKFGRSAWWLAQLRKSAVARGDSSFPARRIGASWFYFGPELAAWVAKQKPAVPKNETDLLQ